jgi:hypothetical protein
MFLPQALVSFKKYMRGRYEGAYTRNSIGVYSNSTSKMKINENKSKKQQALVSFKKYMPPHNAPSYIF